MVEREREGDNVSLALKEEAVRGSRARARRSMMPLLNLSSTHYIRTQ